MSSADLSHPVLSTLGCVGPEGCRLDLPVRVNREGRRLQETHGRSQREKGDCSSMTHPSKVMQEAADLRSRRSNTLGNKLEKSRLETVRTPKGTRGEGGEERARLLFRGRNSRKQLSLSKFGLGIGETGGTVGHKWGVDSGASLHPSG